MTTTTRQSNRIGLCLTGGGITGAMYEVGVLAALEDSFEDFAACDFEVFVAGASGAVVATALAGGFPAQRLYRALLDPSDDFFPLQRNHLLRFDGREVVRISTATVGAVRRLIGSVASKPLDLDLWNELDRFYDSLPAGFFTVDPFERFLSDVLKRRGIPESFDELERTLHIIAYDLDLGERVVFGKAPFEQAPIARAVAASCAVPMLYAPVRIGERDLIAANAGEAGHVDIAVGAGCDTVVVINPVVPVRTNITEKEVPTGHGPKHRIRDKGLLWVYSQAWRLVTEARLERGLAQYKTDNPGVQVVLVEPEREDATMFMYSPMNFASRRVILEDGYTSTIRSLRQEDSMLRQALVAKGLKPTES